MTLSEKILTNAKSELELAILSGNKERELEIIRTIREINAKIVEEAKK